MGDHFRNCFHPCGITNTDGIAQAVWASARRSRTLDAPALRRVGLGHLAGGDSPRGSPWNGCGWAAETLNGVVNHALHCLSCLWHIQPPYLRQQARTARSVSRTTQRSATTYIRRPPRLGHSEGHSSMAVLFCSVVSVGSQRPHRSCFGEKSKVVSMSLPSSPPRQSAHRQPSRGSDSFASNPRFRLRNSCCEKFG